MHPRALGASNLNLWFKKRPGRTEVGNEHQNTTLGFLFSKTGVGSSGANPSTPNQVRYVLPPASHDLFF